MRREFRSIDDYIRSFPEPVQKKLKELREVVREHAPQAQEKISYQMPTFYLNGNLVHFAAYAKHIGFYPTPGAIEAIKDELSGFKYSKGAIQFPLDKALPRVLIRRIVKFRVEKNRKKNDSG